MKIKIEEIKILEGEIVTRGGRTGRKLHRAFPGSSTLRCGKWLRGLASYFKVSSGTIEHTSLCEKCFSWYYEEKSDS